MNTKVPLDSHGFVEWLNHSGDQYTILGAARISTGGDAKKGKKEDFGLLRYLYKNEHLSPFEQVSFQFTVKIPHFIAKQLLRHRTFKFNEYSLRYSEAIMDMYTPSEWRRQGNKNHQGSGDPINKDAQDLAHNIVMRAYGASRVAYFGLLDLGVAREMARTVLPLGNYTLITFTADLRNLMHFLELRLHEHAQKEIRDVAQAIHKMMWQHQDLKWVMRIFDEFNSLKYSFQKAINSCTNTEDLRGLLDQFTIDKTEEK